MHHEERLLRAVWDLLLKGDVDDAPVAERSWYREVLEEPDPAQQLRLVAHGACMVKVRIGAVLRVIRDAATLDADAAALWALIQTDFHDNQRRGGVGRGARRAARRPRRRARHRRAVDAQPPRRLAAARR